MSSRKNTLVTVSALFLFVFSIGCQATEKLTDVVQTHAGPVQGKIENTIWSGKEYAAFKGIPFAAPPVGPLRFKPPVDVEPWTEVLPTVIEGSVCMQHVSVLDAILDPTIGNVIPVYGSEDCLYLNVFTPQTTFRNISGIKLKPVMVWIYGGAFTNGFSNSIVYGPDLLLEDDVVFVSMNYRVGAFGFLSANHKDILGNAGLKDQSFALKWVQKNIVNFGGDPNQVTIFGVSSGGTAVHYHMISKMSEGLFHRSISMSGSPLALWAYASPAEAELAAFYLGKELGHTTYKKDDLVKVLLAANATEIVLASMRMGIPPELSFMFKPTREDHRLAKSEDLFLSECPIRIYQTGNFKRIPHMLGFTKDEALPFIGPLDNVTGIINHVKNYLDRLGSYNNQYNADLLDFNNMLSDTQAHVLIKVLSSLLFDGPIDLVERLIQGQGIYPQKEPIYYYRVSYEPPPSLALHEIIFKTKYNGAGHADELLYIFNMGFVNVSTDPNDPFNIFRKKVTRLFTNFGKYGNPTPNGENDQLLGVTWPDAGKAGIQLDIGETFEVKPRMVSVKTELFEALVNLAAPFISGCRSLY